MNIIIEVGDHSIQGNEYARIFLKLDLLNGFQKELIDMERGDVYLFRFNGVFVKKDSGVNVEEKEEGRGRKVLVKASGDGDDKIGTDTGAGITVDNYKCGDENRNTASARQKISTVVCDFGTNRNDETGTLFCRISKSIDSGRYYHHLSVTESISCCNYSMLTSTPQLVVEHILLWFRKFHPPPNGRYYSFNDNEHHVKQSIYKRRRIGDLNVSNVLSDVLVRVRSLANNDNSTTIPYRHRRNSTLRHAVLMDYHYHNHATDAINVIGEKDTIAFFYDCRSRFHSQLQNTFKSQHSVLITKVLTQRRLSSSAYFHQRYAANESEFILVPTSETTIKVASVDDEINVNDNWPCSTCSQRQSQLTQTHDNNSSHSMSSSFLSHSHSHSQGTNYLHNGDKLSSPHNDDDLMRNPESKFLLHANIVSIYFEDLNSTLGLDLGTKWPNAKELLNLLIITDEIESKETQQRQAQATVIETNFRPAVLTLKFTRNGNVGTCRVSANRDVMATLCGNNDPASLVKTYEHGDGGDSSNDLMLVSDLLKGMLCLHIMMEWTLIRRKNYKTEVEKVHLTSLDL